MGLDVLEFEFICGNGSHLEFLDFSSDCFRELKVVFEQNIFRDLEVGNLKAINVICLASRTHIVWLKITVIYIPTV